MFTREEVLKIAKLARLTLSAEEVERYQKQLGRVLEYVRELQQVPTESEAIVKHVPRDAVSLRGDKTLPFANTRALLENAPSLDGDGFLIPTVVEHE
jgi:aspartyl-tRNA(Asn)/glutamyl-tRNA(Gln) amidotransferase subunit C